jgi:outer membrane protein OmpA-like peptidoglycan-associated protein
MPGGFGKADIWYSIKQDSVWSKPVNAGSKINTCENEMFPVVNDSRLYFSSNGHPGFGGLDLFKTKLVNFVPEKIENMGVVVNSNADDFTLLLDRERKNGYLSSSRYEYIDHVYAVTLTPLMFLYDAKLKLDIASTKALNEIPVLITENNVIIDTIYPDKDGHFIFVGEEDKNYKMEINDPKFFSVTDLYSTVGKTESDTVYRDLMLKSKYIPLNTLVVDEKSNQPLVDADVLIVNKTTGEESTLHTDDAGRLNTELLRDNNYEIVAGKPGFIKNSKDISTKTTAEKIDESIALKKISKGVKFEVENVLYDLGKATLRPESKVELNKIILFLNENPTIKVELSSHTDSRGSDKSNQVLSQKRAQSCVDYLVSQGVSKNSIVAKGYGETQLLNKCKNGVQCDEAEHQRNRRTEIKVLSVQP